METLKILNAQNISPVEAGAILSSY